jgi:hypothetical protein
LLVLNLLEDKGIDRTELQKVKQLLQASGGKE